MGEEYFQVVDFGVYSLDRHSQPDDTEIQQLAIKLTEEIIKNGVALLTNTGYKDDLVKEAWKSFDAFRSFPSDTKAKYGASPDVGYPLNVPVYCAPNKDRYSNKEVDSVECMNLWPLFPDIVYPETEVPGYTTNMKAVWDFNTDLSLRCHECVALGLGLDRHVFHKVFDGLLKSSPGINPTQLRLNYYRPQSDLSDSEKTPMRISGHLDIGCITLIRSEQCGLQVQTRSGDWIDVPCIPGACVALAGTTLVQLFGDKFYAPPHRVVYTKDREMERRSTCFFLIPDSNKPIESILGGKPTTNLLELAQRLPS